MTLKLIKLNEHNVHIRYKESSFTLVQSVYRERQESKDTRVDITLWMLKNSTKYVAFNTVQLLDKLKTEGKSVKDEIHIRKNESGFTADRININDCIVQSNTGFYGPNGIQQISGLDELIEFAVKCQTVAGFYGSEELTESYRNDDNSTIVYELSISALNKPKNLLIFFVTWMKEYQGKTPIDKPYGGGAHVDKEGMCGEMWNFVNVDGYFYGYGMNQGESGVNLNRLLPKQKWEKGEIKKGVDIVYIARSPNEEHCVVGWHKDAEVFHQHYDRKLLRHLRDNTSYGYLSKTKVENAVLIDEFERQPVPKRLWNGERARLFYPDTRPELTKWLSRYIENSIKATKTEKEIITNPNLSSTEKDQHIKARKGQGKFRTNVLNHYEFRCVLTGIQTEELLIASHIMPWGHCTHGKQRLDKHNGLLLAATYDKLFDQGLITFDENGELLISHLLLDADKEKLFRENDVRRKLFNPSPKTLQYLQYHRKMHRANFDDK